MSEDSPRPLPSWEEFTSAQEGKWFFVRWMLAALLPALLLPALIIAGWRDPSFLFAGGFVVGLSQGWVLFRWRWRSWAWLISWMGYFVCSIYHEVSPWVAACTILPISVQMLLLLDVRIHPGWWAVATWGGVSLGAEVAGSAANWSPFLRQLLASRVPLPAWVDLRFPVFSTGIILYFLVTGAALEWVMPPVSPSGQKVPGGDEKG